MKELECQQCELLLRELSVYKKRHEINRGVMSSMTGLRRIMRIKLRGMAEEIKKMEERLQEEIEYSSCLSETLKEMKESE